MMRRVSIARMRSLRLRHPKASFGFWVLGSGFWVVGSGFWVFGSGFWVLGFGFWVLVACLRVSFDTAKVRMAHYRSCNLFDGRCCRCPLLHG